MNYSSLSLFQRKEILSLNFVLLFFFFLRNTIEAFSSASGARQARLCCHRKEVSTSIFSQLGFVVIDFGSQNRCMHGEIVSLDLGLVFCMWSYLHPFTLVDWLLSEAWKIGGQASKCRKPSNGSSMVIKDQKCHGSDLLSGGKQC